jgi:hypothetical protein
MFNRVTVNYSMEQCIDIKNNGIKFVGNKQLRKNINAYAQTDLVTGTMLHMHDSYYDEML